MGLLGMSKVLGGINMKKIISIMLLVMSVILLASCDESAVNATSTASPVLTTNEPTFPSPSPEPSPFLGIEIPFKAANYRTSMDFGYDDLVTYINSPEELAAYYSEYGTDGKLDTMKDSVFLNEKYNEAFFQDKCLMLYYHFETSIRTMIFESVILYEGALSINIKTYPDVSPMINPAHIVIELDKQYSGMDASLNWEIIDKE